jgi:hypothetical protein
VGGIAKFHLALRQRPHAEAGGCALQITAHTERLGRALPVLHPMELLQRSIAS